jgi:endonuclease/exonuclease/phosphatase family metal-dependent hydrolase
MTRWPLLITCLAAHGCGGLDELERAPASNAGVPALKLLTYNVGLAHGAVALADERLPLLPGALEQTGADVVCLNEVWTDDDYESIQAGLQAAYPYSFRERTTDSSWPKLQCLPWTVYSLDKCVKASCTPKGISAEECVRGACKAKYDALSDGCKFCIAANAASPLNCVIWGAHDFAYEGRNGLALFSRYPISKATYTPFDTVMIKRGVITATIEGLRVQCTHMSSDLVVVPYPEDSAFAGWQEEQAAQVEVITRVAREGCTVLMGDLNTGPTVGTIKGEVPSTYEALQEAGYGEGWTAPRCTFCKENPLAGAPSDLWLDHVMYKDCPSWTPRYERVLDGAIQITPSEGDTLTTRTSDHYGLFVDLGATN